jgi:hypothetical protein
MSFLGFGRPQPSSAEKIAAVENELKVIAEMHTRYDVPPHTLSFPTILLMKSGHE